MIKISNENQFKELIKQEKVLVDFFATWCGPCRMLAPILEEIEHEKVIDNDIIEVDVDEFSKIAQLYSIQAIPTLIIFSKGKIVKTSTGYLNKNQLKDFVNK